MIPNTISPESNDSSYEVYPTKTYRLDFVNKRIIGKIEGATSVLQFIRKVLNINKYAYSIYNWYYGNELYILMKSSYDYAVVEAPRIISEALLVDDRIISLDEFSFKKVSVDSMEFSFMVHTVYGTLKYIQEVAL